MVGCAARGLVMQSNFLFDGMVEESGRARAGNAGMRPATHTGDSAPQPVTQLEQVREVALRGWCTLAGVAAETGFPPASISARLRDLRKAHFGAYRVVKRVAGRKPLIWEYRIIFS